MRSIADLVQVPFVALKSIRMSSEDAGELLVLGDFLGGSAPHLEQIDLHHSCIILLFPSRCKVGR